MNKSSLRLLFPIVAGLAVAAFAPTHRKLPAASRRADEQLNQAKSGCAPPTYACARADTEVTALPATLPNWGGLTGANTQFVDTSYNPQYPIRYTRVTDANSGCTLGNCTSGFGVGSGSGDDAHFNANETLFTVTDNGAAWYFFGLNRATMQTGLVWASTATSNIVWSQTNPNYAYELSNVGSGLYRMDFTSCHLGGPTCNPKVRLFYDFANCGSPSGYGFFATAGIGGNDNRFGGAIGAQDNDNRVYAYDASTNTCYFYNTRFGTVRSAVGPQAPLTGTGSCDGTDSTFTWVSGSKFGIGSNTWAGASIVLGSSKVFQVASVNSATSLMFGYTCPSGTYHFSITPGTYVGAISSSARYSVHDLRMEPGGIWLLIYQGSTCHAGACNLIHAWQIGTTTLIDCQDNGSSDNGSCGGHSTETASGWINADGNFPNSTTNPTMQFRTWANFATTNDLLVTELSTVNYTFTVPFDNHPSAKNDPLGTHSYPVFSSTYTPEASAGVITNAYSNEVIAWTQTPGPPLRFGHTFNSSLSPEFTAQYAIGSVSPLGDFYLYTTDGEGTLGSTSGRPKCTVSKNCRSDVFLISLIP